MGLFDLFENKDRYFNRIKIEWLEARDSFPDFFSEFNPEVKAENEQYIKAITADFQKQFTSFPRLPLGRKKWKKDTLNLLKDVLYNETIINLHHSMDQPTIDAFAEEIFEFLRHVRKFAPELTFTDIGQAIRNYIVYAMFKKIHNDNSGFSRSGFGYSMLYPFTDNYIDNNKCTSEEKQAYNRMIHEKINGHSVKPTTHHQSKTCDLLQAIDEEYPREYATGAQQLLLMMLEAQEFSIRQQYRELPLSKEERLDISIYKGGISVLIDRFFVKKEITETDLYFYLEFGFFLQMADDLQDIKEDSSVGHSTLFTLDLRPEKPEKVVNQLLHFLNNIMENYKADNNQFKNFILSASNLLILSSVVGSKEFFSRKYLNMIENYLPIPSSTLENYLHTKIEAMDIKLQKQYFKALDELIK